MPLPRTAAIQLAHLHIVNEAASPGFPVTGATFTTICLWFMSQWTCQRKSSVVQPVIDLSGHFFNSSGCDVIEVEVKAHVRRYHRKHYQKTCQCPKTPNITVAPPPPRLINKGKLGISVWGELLLNKYAYGIPINRQLESYKTQGLHLSPATISFGQAAITPFFVPVADAIREFVAKSNQWHADVTRWIVWGMRKLDPTSTSTGSGYFFATRRFISVLLTLSRGCRTRIRHR